MQWGITIHTLESQVGELTKGLINHSLSMHKIIIAYDLAEVIKLRGEHGHPNEHI